MKAPLVFSNLVIKILLASGIISALLTIFSDVVGGLVTPGYRLASQSASELSAVGASTRPLMVTLNLIAGVLLAAFSIGLWQSAGENWFLRVIAVLLAINATCSSIALLSFPLHLDEMMTSAANKANVVIMFIGVFAFFLSIIFGIFANTGWFRYVSLAIISLFIVFTIMGLLISKTGFEIFGEHGATTGIQERTMIYSWNVWLILQVIVVLIQA